MRMDAVDYFRGGFLVRLQGRLPMTDHAKLLERLLALADWHEKEAGYASTELNFDDEPDGGSAARFHRQAAVSIRALTADRAAEPTAARCHVCAYHGGVCFHCNGSRVEPPDRLRAAEAAPPEGLEPPFDLAHKMQRAALDLAWRAYGDAEYRERLVNWLREYGLTVYRLVLAADPPQIPTRLRAAQESEPR